MKKSKFTKSIAFCLLMMVVLSFPVPDVKAATGGTINTELKSISLGKNSTGNYIYGNIVIVEWVNGKSTVPTVLPKLYLRSTDGKEESEMFVVANGTNTYYFDKFIDGLPTTKTYYIKADLTGTGINRNMLVDQIGSKTIGTTSDNRTMMASQIEGKFVLSTKTSTTLKVCTDALRTATIPSRLKIADSIKSDIILYVTCNTNWSVTSNQSWITIKNGSGIGNGSFNVSIAKNVTSGQTRTGTITIKAGSVTKTITMIQLPPPTIKACSHNDVQFLSFLLFGLPNKLAKRKHPAI